MSSLPVPECNVHKPFFFVRPPREETEIIWTKYMLQDVLQNGQTGSMSPLYRVKVKVKVDIYTDDIPVDSIDFTEITPRYWNSHSHRLLSLGRMSSHFLQLKSFTKYQVLVLLGTHYCWVARGGVDSKLVQRFYT